MSDPTDFSQFESRKRDHIHWALDPSVQAFERNSFDRIHLVHETLPDFSLEEVVLAVEQQSNFFTSNSSYSDYTKLNLICIFFLQILLIDAQFL
jgi:hypothetical protein